jgi:hypothetical protein
MKNRYYCLFFVIAGVICISLTSQSASAHNPLIDRQMAQSSSHLRAYQTLLPTVAPSQELVETSNSRTLPPVGSNAGLVIGASVLVLIIIGGVLGSRRKEKH